jgi:hypothetical protein
VSLLVTIVLFCLYALLVACVEIEIEGAHGWAERLPTWYRVSGPLSRSYFLVSGGRPLTGYHVTMVPALLLSFHLAFALGRDWSLAAELQVLAVWAVWVPLWDAIWFFFNPAYGPAGFRKGLVWWHPAWIGPVPSAYVVGAAASLALAGGAAILAGSTRVFVDQLVLLAAFLGCAAVCIGFAPVYMRVYRRTHNPAFDERDRVAITPPPARGRSGERE